LTAVVLASQHLGEPGETVLVVDDDANVRSAVSDLLQAEGYAVATAENGRAALDLLEHGLPPRAILLDLMMSIMDGWDFRAEQMRKPELRELPVVVMSAAGFSRESVRMQFGDLAFIPKPLDPHLLLATIKSTPRSRDRK
jgi:CheY-like chemotaxis protein